MRKNILKTIAIVASITMGVNANAQVALTKTLPPIGTTYEVWSNVSLPSSTVAPDTGANQIWDYSSITTTKAYDVIIRALTEVPASEQTAFPDAVYVEEHLLPGAPNADWYPRMFYKDDGNYLIEIANKTFGSTLPPLKSDTVFEFNLPYQSTTSLNFGPAGGSGEFVYAGYGTLIIGSDTYNNVVLLKEDAAPDTLFYFFTLTPHYHRLARIFFHNGQRIINYYKPTGAAPSAPAAPSNLTTTPVNSIRLDWQDNSNNEDGFIIETTQDTLSGNWTIVDTVATDVITYIHTGLTNGVTYYYRVKAYNVNGNSAWSNISGATEGTAGISPLSKNDFEIEIYPNPANDIVTIGNVPRGSTLTITDITGKVVYSSIISNEQAIINTTEFVNGVYIIRVENNGTVANRKLEISK